MGSIDGEDLISELPDSVLVHILSFLRIKFAVSTSILSRRWRYIWTSFQNFDFLFWRLYECSVQHPLSELETKRFMDFVDRVLFLHDNPSIQKFTFHVDENFDESRVKRWITTLVKRKIEKLIVLGDASKSCIFPSCLFTCESLTKLDLHMDYNVVNLPTLISFPRLKILRLAKIKAVDENWTQQFFTNCPVLEDLRLMDCIWEDMNFVCISAPTLKHLIISCPDDYVTNTFTTVKIYAPNLLSLHYNEIVAKDFVLQSFPSLVMADIDYIYANNPLDVREQTGYGSTKLLEKLSNVKNLRMTGETFWVLSSAVVPLTNLPAFRNLIHLEVTSGLIFSSIITFFDFLQISPILESLVFTKACIDGIVPDGDDVWTLNMVPQCLLLHLKSVEFLCFCGYPGELEMVKLLLKSAGVLQMMTITLPFGENLEEKTEVKEQLLMFPRGSVSCVVKFSSYCRTLGSLSSNP